MLDGFKKFLADSKQTLTEEISKIKNKSFLEATMAGCAMVAAADGVIDSSEKQKMVAFINQNDALKLFDLDKAIDLFNSFAKKFDFDAEIGKGECLKSIAKIKKNTSDSRLLVRVCCAIGAADGDFDDDEKKVVIDICRELDLNPKDFNLI